MRCRNKGLIKNSLSKKIFSFYIIFLMLVTFSGFYVSAPPGIDIIFPEDEHYLTNNTYVNIGVNIAGGIVNSSFIDWNYSLVGYWNFEHNTSVNITDNSIYGNNATFVNREVDNITSSGRFGRGFYFNGSSDQYLDCGNHNSLDISSNNITIELWVKEFESAFNNKYGNSTSPNMNDDYGSSILQASDGGYVVTGQVDHNANVSDTGNISLIKLDSNGSLLWQQFYGGDSSDISYDVQQTSDGGYIIVGATNTTNKRYDLYLIKTDSDGNVEWERKHGGIQNDSGYSIQQTSEGGYIITGYTESFGIGNEDHSYNKNLWLLKTDSTGHVTSGVNNNESFNRTFGGAGFDIGRSVKQTNDSGYIVVGDTQYFGDLQFAFKNLWLIKTNSTGDDSGLDLHNHTGNWTWGNQDTYDQGRDIQLLRNNSGYIITGATTNDTADLFDVWLIKLNWSCSNNSAGEVFNKKYAFGDVGDNKADKGFSVAETTDGGFVITGSWDESVDSGGLLLMKTERDGTFLWSRSFGEQNKYERGVCIKETTDGGLIIVGQEENISSNSNNRDIWVIKTDANGNVTGSNNNQSLSKTLVDKDIDSYLVKLHNGTIYGYINNESVLTNISLYNLSQYWHHIALTYNGSLIKLYINGTLVSSKAYSEPINTSATNLTIGRNFSGIIDEVRIWNRALSQEEINASYDCSGYYRNFTELNDSNYSYYIYAIDVEGNETQTQTRTVHVDTIAPVITAQSPGSSTTTTSNLAITVSLSDEGTGINTSAIIMKINGVSVNLTTVTNSTASYTMPSATIGSTYTANVSAADYAGNIGYRQWSFKVNSGNGGTPTPPSNNPPTADAGGPYEGFVNYSTSFDGSASSDSDGTIAGYRWDFENDGTYDTDWLTSATTIHSYSSAGNYTVKLQVKDDGGSTDTDTATVMITETPPIDNPPTISNLTRSKRKVTSDDIVTISVDITDDYGISSVSLYWNKGSEDISVLMENTGGCTYSKSIGPFAQGTMVTYWVRATDNANHSSTSDRQNFTVVAPPITKPVENISEGEEKEVRIEGSRINVIKIKSRTDLVNVNITIENLTLDDITEGKKYGGEGVVYKYFDIEVTANDTYVNESDIESAEINFTVDKSWLIENNISNNTMTLYRYYNNTWQKLNTTKIDENNTRFFYKSESPGLSTFAIVGSRVVEKGEALVPDEDEPKIPWAIIIGFIIAAIVILLIILFKARYIYVEEVEAPKKE